MNETTIRAFICFEVQEDLLRYLGEIIQQGRRFNEPVSWSRPENIHLTLKFLGNITDEQRRQVASILHSTAEAYEAFDVLFDRTGAFPSFRRPRVLWIGCSVRSEPLHRLADHLENELARAGFERENRPFSPHLTLGRVKRANVPRTAKYLSELQLTPMRLRCHDIILMKSDLHPSGARYMPLEVFSLKS